MTPDRVPTVLVCTVHFLDSALTVRALRSLPADPADLTVRTVVWDNSGDASAEVHALADQVVTAEDNVGYGRAIARLWSMHESDYVCFLTNDAWLGGGSLERLVAVLEDDPTIGAVGPALVNDRGAPLATTYRYPTVASIVAHQSVLAPRLRRLWRRLGRCVPAALDPAPQISGRTARRPPDAPADVEVIDGALVVVRTAALRAIGGPDPWFCLYGDDHDLCGRLGAAGWRVVHHPGIGGGHSVGSSRRAVADHLLHEKLVTQIELIRRRRGPAAALGLRLLLTASAAAGAVIGRWSAPEGAYRLGPQLRRLWRAPGRLPGETRVRVSGRPPPALPTRHRAAVPSTAPPG